jgi:hypothetical protein
MRETTRTTRGLAAAALVGAGLAAAFVAGALASPFAAGETTTVPIVTWRPRAITLDGRSAERPFRRLIAEMASTPPWQRSARSLSAAEIGDLLGAPLLRRNRADRPDDITEHQAARPSTDLRSVPASGPQLVTRVLLLTATFEPSAKRGSNEPT